MNKKGFTLIELLVVIAIIGVLSSIVLASLNNARNKGNDAKVKSQLSGVRAAAEIYYYGNGYTYTASTMAVAANPCTGTMFVDANSKMLNYTGTAAAWPSTVTLSCQANGTAYAISASLPGAGGVWCVDSVGKSKAEAAHLTNVQFACP